MDNRTPMIKLDLMNDQKNDRVIYRGSFAVEVNKSNQLLEKLVREGCENFFRYFELLGLTDEPNLVVLPSTRHYYYDAEDLKDVKTVVHMKHLNNIKNIKDLLHSIYHILSHQSLFIGVFLDKKYQNVFFSNSTMNQSQYGPKADAVENGIESRIPFLNMMYNIMDLKTNRYMSKQTVSLLLGNAGFKVANMTELNGVTYFCAKKAEPSAE